MPGLNPEQGRIYRQYAQAGPAWTALNDDGKPIAAAGIFIVRIGCGEAWGIITDEARENPFMLHRETKRRLLEAISRCGLRRVNVVIDPENKAAARWAEALGFRREGTMRAFKEDFTDADLWAIAKKRGAA